MILEFISIIGVAIFLDFAFGDPKNKYHLTAWIGKLIALLVPIAKNQNSIVEKLGGVLIVTFTVVIVIIFISFLLLAINLITLILIPADYIVSIVFVFVAGLLLKMTIAINGMQKHAQNILDCLDCNNLDMARANLAMIVKRDTRDLDRDHIISGTLESISENTVDGITGPLFYFAFFGLPGAFLYRVVNTADSMIGYRTSMFKNIGWFAAICDTILNYIPSRLTGLTMIISAYILQNNWRESYKIMMRDASKTQSRNAGYPMAALAGALETNFEKINHYKIGNGEIIQDTKHIHSAVKIMNLSSILFFVMICVPIISALYIVGW